MITKSEFANWKLEIVTKKWYLLLQEMKEDIEKAMVTPEVVLEKGERTKLMTLYGKKELLEDLLTLSIEDFEDDNKEEV